MRSVQSPFFFTSFPSQFTSLQSFSALNNRARHPLKVPGPIPFFDITKHYRANHLKGWDEGMAAWRGMAWWVQHVLVIENWNEIVKNYSHSSFFILGNLKERYQMILSKGKQSMIGFRSFFDNTRVKLGPSIFSICNPFPSWLSKRNDMHF